MVCVLCGIMVMIFYSVPSAHQKDSGHLQQQFPQSYRIIAAGNVRSGSTWQYNALRLLLQQKLVAENRTEIVQFSAGHLRELPRLRAALLSSNFSVIKLHEFDASVLSLADFVFTSHRDPRDVYVSIEDLGVFSGGMELEASTSSYNQWLEYSCYDLKYEEMISDPLRELDRMASALGIPRKYLDLPRILLEIAKYYDEARSKKSDWHPISAFHEKHIQHPIPGNWKSYPNQKKIAAIEEQYGEWMMDRGYELHFHPQKKMKMETDVRKKDTRAYRQENCPLKKHEMEKKK